MRRNSRLDDIHNIKKELEADEPSKLLSGLRAFNAKLASDLHSTESANSLRLRDSFITAVLNAPNLEQLEKISQIFSEKVQASLTQHASKIRTNAEPFFDLLGTEFTGYILGFDLGENSTDSYYTPCEDYTGESPRQELRIREVLSDHFEFVTEDYELLILTQKNLDCLGAIFDAEDDIMGLISLIRNSFKLQAECQALISIQPPADNCDKAKDHFEKIQRLRRDIEGRARSIQHQFWGFDRDKFDEKMRDSIAERKKKHESGSTPLLGKLAKYEKTCQEAWFNALRITGENIRKLRSTLEKQGVPSSNLCLFFDRLEHIENSKERRKLFLQVMLYVCEPRDLITADFAPRPAPENKYQRKAELFMLFLAQNSQYHQMLNSGQDLQAWFSYEDNLEKFTHFARITLEKVSKAVERPDYRDPAHKLLSDAAHFIRQNGYPITPLQLFAPTVSYARTDASDVVCTELAGKLDLQRFLLDHQGETALTIEEIRAILIEDKRAREANSPFAAFGSAMGW